MSEEKKPGLILPGKSKLPYEAEKLRNVSAIEAQLDSLHAILGCDEMEKYAASIVATALAEIGNHYINNMRKYNADPMTQDKPYSIREFVEPILVYLDKRSEELMLYDERQRAAFLNAFESQSKH